MRLGITAFLTDRDIPPATLAAAAEERGFDSFFLPEHTHLPVRADHPPALVEGVRPDDYRRGLCPLVALSTAVPMTQRIGLGTGILLAAQHDPIVLAKQVATLDHLSGGRFTLGIGFGWNRAEAEDHGVDFGQRHAIVREHLLCMQALWSTEQAEFHGAFVDLAPAWAWPKPKQQPRVRVLIGGGSGDAGPCRCRRVRRRLDAHRGQRVGSGDPAPASSCRGQRARSLHDHRGPLRDHRQPASKLEHFAALGVTEVVLRVRSGDTDEVLAQLDALTALLPVAASLDP
jgi:probable F420-dependent oxidoreductase